MILIDKAMEAIHKHVKAIQSEVLPIEETLGRISAEQISAKFDLPRFDNSAMDGYAVNIADAGSHIKSRATILAGDMCDIEVQRGEGAKIMTGAMMPKGADAVVPIEDIIENEKGIELPTVIKEDANIRKKGEDVSRGENIIETGDLIGAYTIAQLASQGITHIHVRQMPKIAVFATGHELRMHYDEIEPYQIYNSNAPTFISRAKELGCEAKFTGVATDTLESIKSHIAASLDNDLIVTSGGVSVGDADFTKEAFMQLGMETLFSKVNIKPGKPTTIGRIGKTWIINLPGNPSAAAVNFELFARSIINRLHGINKPFIAPINATLDKKIKIKPGKYTVLMGKYDGETFSVLKKQGAGMVSPLNKADGLIIIPPHIDHLDAGSRVKMISLHQNMTAEAVADIFTLA